MKRKKGMTRRGQGPGERVGLSVNAAAWANPGKDSEKTTQLSQALTIES